MRALQEIGRAARNVLASPVMRSVFFAVALVVFAVMFTIPVRAVPGNTLQTQADLFKAYDYAVMTLFALLTALLIVFQVSVIRSDMQTRRMNGGSLLLSSAGFFSALVSVLLASATCVFCLGAFVGLLGFSAIALLLTWRWYIVALATLILFLSLYFAARRINRGCEVCIVPQKK